MDSNSERRAQEEARGWHRGMKPIIEDDMVPPGTMYALNFNSMKIVRDAKEYEHDRRLRGQYE
jgi:hypothetical protein